MLSAHSVAQIRAAEERLAATTGWDELMQRAARGLADALAPIPAGAVVVMLVGPGNNGGDALFAATHLLDRGVRVDLCLLDPDTVHEAGLAAALGAGASVIEAPDRHRYCVDALFGIGARPGLEGRAEQWANWVATQRPWTVAVDVPSGVNVDAASNDGVQIPADLIVTFGSPKPFVLAANHNAEVVVVDIGLTPHLDSPVLTALEPSDGDLLRAALPDPAGHKYSRGVLGVAAGSSEYAGAAHLCVAGAQAGPAGMIHFSGSAELAARVVDRAPEVVSTAGRVNAWVVGPGVVDPADCIAAALDSGVATVFDAGALDHLPTRFETPAVLTPHAGELARMLKIEREVIEAAPLPHAQQAAERFDAVVLLKGQRSIVAAPDGTAAVNQSGSPWLGTAGSGDVLAGFIGSLLAVGIVPFDAARLGAFLHGAAAVAANPGGPVTASAVAAALPSAVADFLSGTLIDVRRKDWT